MLNYGSLGGLVFLVVAIRLMETFKNTLVTDSKRKRLLRESYCKYFHCSGFELL